MALLWPLYSKLTFNVSFSVGHWHAAWQVTSKGNRSGNAEGCLWHPPSWHYDPPAWATIFRKVHPTEGACWKAEAQSCSGRLMLTYIYSCSIRTCDKLRQADNIRVCLWQYSTYWHLSVLLYRWHKSESWSVLPCMYDTNTRYRGGLSIAPHNHPPVLSAFKLKSWLKGWKISIQTVNLQYWHLD